MKKKTHIPIVLILIKNNNRIMKHIIDKNIVVIIIL